MYLELLKQKEMWNDLMVNQKFTIILISFY